MVLFDICKKFPASAVFAMNQKVRQAKKISSCTGIMEMTSDCLAHIRPGSDCLHPSSTHSAKPYQKKEIAPES